MDPKAVLEQAVDKIGQVCSPLFGFCMDSVALSRYSRPNRCSRNTIWLKRLASYTGGSPVIPCDLTRKITQ